ncbi:MAG: DNA/RNA non-specific endonuclease [Pseudomonadota bacterium]
MTKTVFQCQMDDLEALEGLRSVQSELVAETTKELPTEMVGIGNLEEAVERIRTGAADIEAPAFAEAIVMLHGFPSLLITNGDYQEPRNPVWRKRLNPHRARIREVIANVARVDLVNHPDFKWVGTAWRVNEDTFVTNRHVANVFAEARRGGFKVQPGVRVFLDYAEEHGNDAEIEQFVSSILHIEDRSHGGIDMAILRVERAAADCLGEPIQLATGLEPEIIGVVGYPAHDPRNPEDAMDRIFGGIFNVKRLAPGRILDFDHSSTVMTHNATTLGGNSGSVVFDVETGGAVGLHFAGSARVQNFAAKADAVADVLRRTSVSFGSASASPSLFGQPDGNGDDDDEGLESNLSDRDGYDPGFIGSGDLAVPLPQLNCLQQRNIAKTEDGEEVLKYRHFSVVMNARRKLAYFAAANVDGSALRRPRRRGFKLDGRIEREHQSGNELYKHNPLDRGHLIRRLDPAWGTAAEADEANRDSMFYTNIGPQHKDLNQKVWLGLEDQILDLTDERDARVSVFVGCLFEEDDPVHQPTGTKVPMGFWKVVASVGRVRSGRGTRRVLQAQAFVLFQDHLVRDQDLEIIFGRDFTTHQVTVEELERMTGLDFHVLRDADTFGLPPELRAERIAAAAGSAETPYHPAEQSMKPLTSLEDIVRG